MLLIILIISLYSAYIYLMKDLLHNSNINLRWEFLTGNMKMQHKRSS